ncbi:hypothetical protein BJY04DRAFT_212830 [Aspergillus karnatakaensis]|uniref:Zn(II)2Cys6 transcription factor domain-containing protein n=1 Tax=Aspergillus karnatakaensis TaxID=1810916 RepID=UPI003CCD1CC1
MSSSVERDNPPPRLKACNACRAAKRRCDLALPACFRCTRRGIACAYPGLPPPDQMPDFLSLLNERDGFENACSDAFAFPSVSATAPFLESPAHLQSTPIQPSPWEHHLQRDPSDVIQLHPNTELTHVRTTPSVPLSTLMETRFQYAIDTLKDTPRMMVMENNTPWSHRELYSSEMPKVMQDAYACCALFITKNSINAAMVTSHVNSRHQEIVLAHLPTSREDLLAHTHALLLYQIMQVFDPDLTAAANTSSLGTLSMSALESAASLLFTCTHFPPPTELEESPDPNSHPSKTVSNPIRATPTLESTIRFWPIWLFEESARRTILFTFYFLQIVHLFRGTHSLKCDGKLGLLHSWYASAYLWNAPTALDFALVWSEREHWIVRNANFEKMLTEASPGDVDVLGRMLLVTIHGVDKLKEWFVSRGSIL